MARELVKKMYVGDYTFDIKTNRQIVLDAFKKYPKFWEIINNAQKLDVNNIDDIGVFENLLDANDEMEKDKPAFCEYLLPIMIKLAGENIDVNEFWSYCKENEVEDIVYDKILEFSMLGFTNDKGEKKPKVKVNLM